MSPEDEAHAPPPDRRARADELKREAGRLRREVAKLERRAARLVGGRQPGDAWWAIGLEPPRTDQEHLAYAQWVLAHQPGLGPRVVSGELPLHMAAELVLRHCTFPCEHRPLRADERDELMRAMAATVATDPEAAGQ